MENKLLHNSNEFILNRYPETNDNTLRAWSNAELLVLNYLKNLEHQNVHVFNDRFGVWNCTLHHKNVRTIWTYASQKKAVLNNLSSNNLSTNIIFNSPLEDIGEVQLALIKIPKSLELFELFLKQISKYSVENTQVVCGFMTKYFSKSYLTIAEKYFENVEQSKAWKKARLLVLRSPKKVLKIEIENIINTINWKENRLKQYLGVFSSDKIDIGTQFLLSHLKVKKHELTVLDVASGNGIISYEVLQQLSNAKVTLVDDFNLAIESSKLNIENARFICTDTIEGVTENEFDLILSNPPFHFEHENNIDITLYLFRRIKKCLKVEGRFLMVANAHLNYKTHLVKLFSSVQIIAKNTKFIIYECKC
ncbi:hypothetical protein BTO06_10465 [Tenacibaculum sp. SZ-18]|uniref:class I SAM-dependent methyltransferase n=1 Tax=Tenacibaculum sp. SZ-18 TaxID=754423 RepID=UPI000C2D1D7F|nr:methyltransferase [Tenacibaculum sp. SZ-18]AUC15538.1 hypothetical protein BTO06_10465 [Tenacibaculum sp. SZ-18]